MSEQPQLLYKDRYVPGIDKLDTWEEHGGYEAFKKALTMDPDAIITEVRVSGLRGRGGAGFPTHVKWSAVPKNRDVEHYLVINADEGEPGTAKDRDLMNGIPHILVEGCLCSMVALRASKCYIYIRGEYVEPWLAVQRAINEAYKAGYCGKNVLGSGLDFDIYTHLGAGAYECGEESALMSSLMGERGMPRLKPPAAPLPMISGVWQRRPSSTTSKPSRPSRPSSTLAAKNMRKSATARPGHAAPSSSRSAATSTSPASMRSSSERRFARSSTTSPAASATVTRSKLISRRLVDGLCDHQQHGLSLRLRRHSRQHRDPRSRLGRSDRLRRNDLDRARYPAAGRFLPSRILWKCTPCREGLNWLHKIYARILEGAGREQDLDLIWDICDNIRGKSFCALGEGAIWPVMTSLRLFRDEYLAWIRTGHDPITGIAAEEAQETIPELEAANV